MVTLIVQLDYLVINWFTFNQIFINPSCGTLSFNSIINKLLTNGEQFSIDFPIIHLFRGVLFDLDRKSITAKLKITQKRFVFASQWVP